MAEQNLFDMNMQTRKEGNTQIILVVEKRIEGRNAVSFKNALQNIIAPEIFKIVLNLSCVEFMDSSGVGAIVSMSKNYGREKIIVLCNIQQPVMSLLKMIRMHKVFTIYENENEALGKQKAPPKEETILLKSPETSNPKKVIVADDVITIRTIVGKVFKKAEYQVLEATNGQEVIDLAKTQSPDLIVMDLRMAGRDGLSAIYELQMTKDLGQIPIVILSGETDQKVVEKVKSFSNVITFIQKDHLSHVIQELEKHV